MSLAQKTQKRIQIIDTLVGDLGKKLTPYARGKSERYIAETINQHFLEQLTKIYTQKLSPSTAETKANSALKWESNKDTTIKQLPFFGTRHQPDFTIEIEKTRIAIELKRVASGSSIREGIGQSLFYSRFFDFVILILVDKSLQWDIRLASGRKPEKQFISELWQYHNIKLIIV